MAYRTSEVVLLLIQRVFVVFGTGRRADVTVLQRGSTSLWTSIDRVRRTGGDGRCDIAMRSSDVSTKVGASGEHQAALAALKWSGATMLVHVIVELLTCIGREFAVVARMNRLTFVRFAVHAQRVPRRIVAVHFNEALIGFCERTYRESLRRICCTATARIGVRADDRCGSEGRTCEP